MSANASEIALADEIGVMAAEYRAKISQLKMVRPQTEGQARLNQTSINAHELTLKMMESMESVLRSPHGMTPKKRQILLREARKIVDRHAKASRK